MGPWEALGWAIGGGVLTLLVQYAWRLFWSLGHQRNFQVPPEVDHGPDYGLSKQLDIIRNAKFGHLRVIQGYKSRENDENEGK